MGTTLQCNYINPKRMMQNNIFDDSSVKLYVHVLIFPRSNIKLGIVYLFQPFYSKLIERAINVNINKIRELFI